MSRNTAKLIIVRRLTVPLLLVLWLGVGTPVVAQPVDQGHDPQSAVASEQVVIPANTFVMGLPSTVSSFDPGRVFRKLDTRVVNNMYEGLYMSPAGEGPVLPGVALSHELSEDGTLYTFQLRPDARWSNGDAVTARNFVTAWLRMIEPGTQREYSYLFGSIRNAAAFSAGEVEAGAVGVRALDDLVLQVELTEPVPYFIEQLSFCPFFPVHTASVQAHGAAAFELGNIVSNGPYALVEHSQNLISLDKNPHYWDSQNVQIEHLRIRMFENEQRSLEAYLSGQVEWVSDLPQDQLASLMERDDLHQHEMFGTYYLRVNVTDPVFNDPRVRRALSLAIDRERLCREVLDGQYAAAFSFVPPMANYQPLPILTYDPVRAREELEEAGFGDGFGFPSVRFVFNTTDLHRRVATAIQEMWLTNLNVHTAFTATSWENFLQNVESREYHVARFGWVGDFLDPDTFLYLMVSSNLEMNSGWSNAAYDELMRRAFLERDLDRRYVIYKGAEAILMNELPIIPLFYYTQYHLIAPSIQGLEMNLRDVHLVRYISKAE